MLPKFPICYCSRRGGNSAAVGGEPDTQLNPNREATRAEVAAFVYQALVNAGRAQAISLLT